MKPLTVLHTSDWHIGHQLYKKRREDEFEAFFQWLLEKCCELEVDVLIVAGDIFDSPSPGSYAQKMYYDFLSRLSKTSVRHVVITAGNHDSPAILTIADRLLSFLNIHVIGSITDNLEDEVKLLCNASGLPELVICAVPYLRERDTRLFVPGETREQKAESMLCGIREHYKKIGELAKKKRGNLDIPIIATGHLFITGTKMSEEERSLYVGTLDNVPCDIFTDDFDYVALGHIHRTQMAGKQERIYYSGSPIAMSFGEAPKKNAVLVKFCGHMPEISLLPVPAFKTLKRIKGSLNEAASALNEIISESKDEKNTIWAEIQLSEANPGQAAIKDLHELAKNSNVEILCVKTERPNISGPAAQENFNLEDLSPHEVFLQWLQTTYPDQDEIARKRLLAAFDELVGIYEEDKRLAENENS